MFSIERGFPSPGVFPWSAVPAPLPSRSHLPPLLRPVLPQASQGGEKCPSGERPHRYTAGSAAVPLPVTVPGAGGAGGSRHGAQPAAPAPSTAPVIAPAVWEARVQGIRRAATEEDKALGLFDLVDYLLHELQPLRGPLLIGNPHSPALAKTNEWHETPLYPVVREELFDHYRDALQLAREIDATRLPPHTADHLTGLDLLLSLRMALAGHTEYLTPISHMVDSWPIHMLRIIKDQIGLDFSSREDVALFLDILRRWPDWIAQARHNMEQGLLQGVSAPRASIREAIRVIENAGALRRSPLYEAASRRLRELDLPPETVSALDAEYWRVVDDHLVPGYQALHGFLNKYVEQTRVEDGLHAVPGGVRQYGDMVRLLTCSTYELEEVREMLQHELRRAEAGVDQIQHELQIEASRLDFMTYMNDRARQEEGFSTPLEVLACFESTIQTIQRQAHLVIPVAGPLIVHVQQIPAGQPAQYVQPKPGSNVSTILVPVDYSNLAEYTRPKIAVSTTHELIGHGYFSIYRNLRNVRPSYAHRVELAGPRESFAMYSERLVEPLGFAGPSYRFEAAQNRLATAVWADLTLRLHLGEISLQESVVEYQDRTASLPEKAQADMLRSLVWGGQEQAFWLNTAVIDRARYRAELQLGPELELLEFHRAVMDAGEQPPHLVERALERWMRTMAA
jgi:uncharacterized protein (DUF885 family)